MFTISNIQAVNTLKNKIQDKNVLAGSNLNSARNTIFCHSFDIDCMNLIQTQSGAHSAWTISFSLAFVHGASNKNVSKPE